MSYKKKKTKIVFLGDSITEQATRYGGYIRLLQNLLQEAALEDDYELKGAGVAGDKIDDLYLRLEEDVLANGADIVVIFIGINDAEHNFTSLAGTDIVRFEAGYVAVVEKLLSAGIRVVVCTPGSIGAAPTWPGNEDKEIDVFSDLIRKLALQYELPLVDLMKAFDDYSAANNFENNEPGILTTDKVHLTSKGNQLVAEEMWQVLKNVN